MEFVETHCHLDDDAFADDLPNVLRESAQAGVERFINIGYEPESWERTLVLARRYSTIRYVVGMHPNSAERWSSQTALQLEELLTREHPVGIGETGLDFFLEHADHDAQRQAFRDQLALAQKYTLPVVIHMRGPVEDEIISNLSDFANVRAVLHSFDGSATLRDFIIDRGDAIGVGGLMTRSSSSALRDVLRSVPLESILLETDSPYLTPRGIKTRRNTPVSIPVIAGHLTNLLDRPIETIAKQTTENAERVFQLTDSSITGQHRDK